MLLPTTDSNKKTAHAKIGENVAMLKYILSRPVAIAGRPKAEGIQHICSAIVAVVVVVVVGLSSIAVAKKGEKSAKICM